MIKRDGFIKLGLLALFAIACIVFFLFYYPYHLFFKEQMQLFLFTSDYSLSYLYKPAALSCYLGDFFTQFFYLRGGGPVVISLTLCLEWLLISYVLKKTGTEKNALLYAFFPIVAEWILHCGLNYSLSSTVSLLLSLVFFAGYTWINKRWLAICAAILLQPLLYMLTGCGLFVFNLLLLFYEYGQKGKFKVVEYLFLLVGFILPLLFRSTYLLTIEQAYFFPHKGIMAFSPSLLLMLTVWSMSFYKIRNFTSDIRYVPFVIVFQLILLGGGIYWGANFSREKILSLDSEAYFGNWGRVLHLANTYKINNTTASYYTNLALARHGVLPDHLLEYYQPASEGLFLPVNPAASPLTILFSNEVFFYLGDINMSQHSAMLGMIFSPNNRSSRLVKRLAEINLINGEKEAARKYLRMLEPTLFHRSWALKRIALLEADTLQTASNKWLSEKRSQLVKRDILRKGDNYPASLELLVESNPGNKMALDYLMCYHLLNKNITEFVQLFDRYAKGRMSIMPRIYSEALLIWLFKAKASEKEVQQYGISPDVIRDFANYTRIYEQDKGEMKQLQESYGKSYWFYFHFANMVTK